MSNVKGVRKLPEKALLAIFDYAAQSTMYDTHRATPFLLHAGHVSQRWRSIIHGTPSLWRAIPIVDPSRLKYPKYFIEKSGDSDLDVFVHAKNSGTTIALGIILESADRLSSLSVRIATAPLLFVVVNSLRKVVVPRLKRLELIIDAPPTRVGHIPSIFIEQPPTLTSLRLQGSSFEFGNSLFNGLTSLSLSGLPRDMGQPSHSTFRDIFWVSRKLRHLSLVCVVPKLPQGVEYDEIDASSLVSFHLTVTESCKLNHVQGLFNILSAPSLETLSFTADGVVSLGAFETSIQVISARYPILRELRLTIVSVHPPLGSTVTMELFQSFPELRYLVLNVVDDGFAEYFLHAWILASESANSEGIPLVWPKFELLTLRAPYLDREDGEQVDDLLETLGTARLSLEQYFDVFEESILDARHAGLREIPKVDYRWSVSASDRRAMETKIAFTDV